MHPTERVQFISMLSQDTSEVQPEVPKGPIISGVSNKLKEISSCTADCRARNQGMLVFPRNHNKFVKQ